MTEQRAMQDIRLIPITPGDGATEASVTKPFGNLEDTIATLKLLAASGSRVQIGHTFSTGQSDKPATVMTAADAILYCESMTGTASYVAGVEVRYTIFRWEA